ncbi:MAG: hypothetical protein N3A01_07600 [Bacteroidales bacterium]|nr:hypothetical protein [Bacteroidales bacterium]
MKTIKVIWLLMTIISLVISLNCYSYKYLGEAKKAGDEKSALSGCPVPSGATIFGYNNVRTIVYTGGDMWWDLQSNAFYEIPKGSGKHALFAGAIWIGGTDVNGQLRVCAARYRANGSDYYAGPLKAYGPDRGTTTIEMCIKYDRHFPSNRNDVVRFRQWFRAKQENNTELLQSQFANYSIPDFMKEWPAINPEPDYSYYLAPFWDYNGDGYYNPEDGDYPFYDIDKIIPCGTTPDKRRPRLYGDYNIWWVYNDRGNIHTETKGATIGMELQAQYFCFTTNDELNNMTFVNTALINRSTYTLMDCYFGVWTDADMGDAWDDYVGTEVNRGLGYLYNGDEEDGDGNGQTYGKQPPAIGVDFFEGPYQDPDGKDNLSNWNPVTKQLECNRAPIFEGSINGLNFEDGVVDDERWGMRRFIYFNNCGGPTCDPTVAIEYYRYLRGYWRDGTRMTYGGTGYNSSNTPADFMFPYDSDPCWWGTGGIQQSTLWYEKGENNTPYDRRFVQSSGPFTLLPGAVNDITTGIVWARATVGGAWASVKEVFRADDKAQRLFEVCFKLIDGPFAPEMQIIELDRQLVFHLYNIPGSNNYNKKPEDYVEEDPFIVCPNDMPNCDNKYRFQGYQVFQLRDQSCSVTDIGNPDKARLVFQCDIKDGVGRIVNFEYDNQIGYAVPVVKVDGADMGIKHTFTLTDDAFATGDKRLVNNKTYYYVAIAYAYNNYKTYDPNNPMALDGQKMPYLASRMGYGKPIKVYSAVPHKIEPENNGTILNASYGYGPKIVQLDGHGNGTNALRLTQRTINRILNSPKHKTDSVEYENNYGPVQIKVIDPLNVKPYDFILKFIPDSTTYNPSTYRINEAKWMLVKLTDPKKGDTVYSETSITLQNEQIIAKWGISITIHQIWWPLKDTTLQYQNGYIESKIEYENPLNKWIEFIPDIDGCDFPNWIRAGKQTDQNQMNCADFQDNVKDKEGYFEKVVDGTWGPYSLVMQDGKKLGNNDASIQTKGLQFYRRISSQLSTDKKRLSSIMFVITKDKSKWTRCPVIEMADLDLQSSGWVAGISEGGAKKYQLRRHKSVDKEGREDNIGDPNDPTKSNYISETGMGWFPGYAIDMETGERLNIAFGENSRYPHQNGRDMIWNPTSDYADATYYQTGGLAGNLYLGGQHVIYVFGHNDRPSSSATQVDSMPAYDEGRYLVRKLKQLETLSGSTYEIRMAFLWNNAMWVSIPMLSSLIKKPAGTTDPYWFIQGDVKIYISVANPYQVSSPELRSANPFNNGFPAYYFSLKDVAPIKGDKETAKNALDLIRVVPNPYYGYSGYENSQLDYKVKITNLPQKCTISIFNVSGTLIRRFKKDSPLTYQDWDLKNEYGIPIASGVYIIHIDAPGIGEKIVKWFGVLRPIDLNNF